MIKEIYSTTVACWVFMIFNTMTIIYYAWKMDILFLCMLWISVIQVFTLCVNQWNNKKLIILGLSTAAYYINSFLIEDFRYYFVRTVIPTIFFFLTYGIEELNFYLDRINRDAFFRHAEKRKMGFDRYEVLLVVIGYCLITYAYSVCMADDRIDIDSLFGFIIFASGYLMYEVDKLSDKFSELQKRHDDDIRNENIKTGNKSTIIERTFREYNNVRT
jgi:hypothetical protein